MLEQVKIGDKFNSLEFIFENKDIRENDDVYQRINGKSYQKNDDIPLDDLTYIKMLHYNYDGDIVVGEMIVNKVIIDEVREVFSNLFLLKYQINSMRLIDDFWDKDGITSDRNSVASNNSSGFCYRKIPNKITLSNHALGLAIDINPLDNPYTPRNSDGTFDYSLLTDYEKNLLVDREEKAKENKHIITLNDSICKVFASVGYECGGIWPLQSDEFSCDWQHFEPNETKMKEIKERMKKVGKSRTL